MASGGPELSFHKTALQLTLMLWADFTSTSAPLISGSDTTFVGTSVLGTVIRARPPGTQGV